MQIDDVNDRRLIVVSFVAYQQMIWNKINKNIYEFKVQKNYLKILFESIYGKHQGV